MLFFGPVFDWSSRHTFLGLRIQKWTIKTNDKNTTNIAFNEFGAKSFHLSTPTNTEVHKKTPSEEDKRRESTDELRPGGEK